ncbi:hypothetical protein AJ80_02683 [Polytolypa hystricis UAMH7299]|uniref:Uncharacterized protein n=1 Tax=Polytolypa hystricis (strain UAMH7299) TaxID=1447883 RepID=A0A2B7YRM3_POLH7|nr:hypothetical protein AJ80_02683 [Polytolypa hystricis UAMH7299]
MPLPTRSLSIRERSRSQIQQKQTGQEIAGHNLEPSHRRTNSSFARPTSYIESVARDGSATLSGLQRQGTADAAQPAASRPRANTVANRRSLLPQRSSSHRNGPSVTAGKPQLQQIQQDDTQAWDGGIAQLRQLQHEAQPPPSPVSARRESISQFARETREAVSKPTASEGGKTVSSNGNTNKNTNASAGNGQEPKPLPQNRLERSASLRQPAVSRSIPASSHLRHRSQLIGVPGARQSNTRHNDPPKTTTTPPLRPGKAQFSTFQQRFSPKKPAKPAAAAPPGATYCSGENWSGQSSDPHISSLQTELLQLHLLHSQYLQSKATWEQNVEKDLRKRHASVVTSYRSIVAAEQASQRHANIKALCQFADDIIAHNSRYDFSEQIQMLSRVVRDVADLSDARNGRYSICLREFEEWFQHAVDVRQSRKLHLRDDESETVDSDIEFIDPMHRNWKNEVAALNSKLELLARELDCLDLPSGQIEDPSYSSSALFRTVQGHKTLLAAMIRELGEMETIEAEIISLERLQVRNLVDNLGRDNKDGSEPAWRGSSNPELYKLIWNDVR